MSTLVAQQTVTGTVTDSNGEAMIGVNILEDGTTNGTITDLDGTYNLSVANGATIVFSFTGMITTTEAVNGRSTIDLVMSEASELIDEVIVTALGFEVKKDNSRCLAPFLKFQLNKEST